MRYVILFTLLLFLGACAQTSNLYYYGDTSHSYYKAVKLGDQKSLEAYKNSLNKVFTRAERYGEKVAPGLFCDYAMILVGEGKLKEAKTYFLKEKQAWPESVTLVDFLIQRYYDND